MQLKRLLTDDDAVSPVIGVILMVAITVILAAVIGTFVLGLGKNVQQTSPTASISFDQQGEGPNAEVKISHDSGDTLNEDNIDIKVNGDSKTNKVDNWGGDGDKSITAGESVSVGGSLGNGATVKVIWTSDSGQDSSILNEYTVS